MTDDILTEAKRVTEHEELRNMLAKVTAPCPFKPGDIVLRAEGIRRSGIPAIVVELMRTGENDMIVLWKVPDKLNPRGYVWETCPASPWQYRLVE